MLLEDERKVQKNNYESVYVYLNKKWARFNNVVKGTKLKLISGGSVCIVIAPGSPVYEGEAYEAFKKEMAKW